MASNFIQPGETLDLIAPTGGVVKGTAYIIGAIIVVALETTAQTLPFRATTIGVWSLAKAASQAWTEGQAVYFDSTNKWFSNVATVGFFRAGVAVEAVAGGAGDVLGKVRLTGEVTFAVSATYVQR